MTIMPTPVELRHFIDLKDMGGDTLRLIIEMARRWKSARAGWPKGQADIPALLSGHTLAMIFEKSSTRTRVSFEVAMQQMGGSSLVLAGDSMQLGRGETVGDTARVMGRYVDAIMIRAYSHDSVIELARDSGVPVINALTDRSHPCQLMADIMTFEEHRGPVKGKTIAWVGDGNNVATSLIEAAVRFGFSLRLGCPEGYKPAADALAWAAAEGGDVTVTEDPVEAVAGADAVMTDTFVSMGDSRTGSRMKTLAPYQVNGALFAKAAPGALFLHCLPAHRGEEVTADVIDGPASVVWDEAENRLHVQKAILAWCLGKF